MPHPSIFERWGFRFHTTDLAFSYIAFAFAVVLPVPQPFFANFASAE
jgi:hypothetical protein